MAGASECASSRRADLFPVLSADELKALAADIKEHGLRSPIILCQEGWRDKDGPIWLLDGRNRLDALALLGWLEPPRERSKREPAKKYRQFVRDNPLAISEECPYSDTTGFQTYSNCDPYALARSLNVHRRHLDAETKRDIIANLLKAKPETSDRSIGEIVDADHKTVAKVRARLEDVGTIPHVEARIDSKNRKQPAKKAKPVTDSSPSDDHHKPGDYWTLPDCADDWHVHVVTDEMGPVTWKSKEIVGFFETEAEAQAWIVEEDRKTCIALNQKVLDAERAVAEFKTATGTDDEPEPTVNAALNDFDTHVINLLQLIKGRMPQHFAKTAVAQPLLGDLAYFLRELVTVRKLVAETEPQSASGNDVDTADAAKAAHAADDLDIRGTFLDRTGDAV